LQGAKSSAAGRALRRTRFGADGRALTQTGNVQRCFELAIVTSVRKETAREGQVKVFCRSTNGNAEIRCGICGQGFVLFWERHPRTERIMIHREIQETLRRHHRAAPGREAHPRGGFLAPGWGDPNDLAASALKRDASTIDL
jgi:hypothetical protein